MRINPTALATCPESDTNTCAHTWPAQGTEAEVGAGGQLGLSLGLSLSRGNQLCELSPDWIIVQHVVAVEQIVSNRLINIERFCSCFESSESALSLYPIYLSLSPSLCVTWFVWIKYAQIDWLLKWCIVIRWFFSFFFSFSPQQHLSAQLYLSFAHYLFSLCLPAHF